jgi:4-carboxymuconolactone decarboxylase
VGWEAQDLLELAPILAVFAGFPAAINMVVAARDVFESRGMRGTPESPLGYRRTLPEGRRREEGLIAMRAISGSTGSSVLEGLRDLSPDLADYILDFSYGDVLSRPGLPLRVKELSIVALLTALGTAEPQLQVHIVAANNVGCSREEILEAVQQMAAYAGFPAALNGLSAARKVM